VHPYEEARGFQRLLDLPGYDAITLAEKTGKSESLIYSRLALLHLISEVAEAFRAERITASHANLIARLPQDFQQQAFEACWRKDYQDKEAHLLPAKHLSAWITNNVYLPLDEAPFDREDATLNPGAGACSACPRRSGYNTSLFFDVAADQCLDGNCYHAKLAEHIDREVAARPELVRIETDHGNPKERPPGTLSRWEYTEVEAPEVENEDAEVTPCGASKPAIVVYGEGAGTTRTICIDPECPVHHPCRVVPIDPDAEARRKQHEKEQARRRRLEKDRAETFSRILENAPATFTAPQLRVLLRAFITCELYGQSDVVATHYAGEDDDNNQSSEEILLSVADRLEEVQLPELALRLALCSHIHVPNENEIDHLAEVEKVFAPRQAKKPTTKKKTVRKPTPAKGKTAKKKATKRTAA
jgi:ParB family chromosome partitioning protein